MNTRPVEDENESDLAASRGEAAASERARTTRKDVRKNEIISLDIEEKFLFLGRPSKPKGL
jgi:hypothetical protein